ncbi:MAG: histidine phosphatase family protein [Lachnospiraceae bacterium]|nr:histidine phosphatase family protein [Lachnospiraceae bacterium]
MDIYLLRHGETDWNKKRLLQWHTDIPLNERGRAQVDDTVRKLLALGVRMDAIVASPLKRARETAEIAAHRLDYPKEKIIVEELLIERGFGEGEGMSLDGMKESYPDSDCPGMESGAALVKRAGQAFQKITTAFCDAEQILLAAHGAVLFALLEAVSEEPIPYEGRAACITQGSLYRIRKEGDRVSFAGYDEKAGGFVEMDAAGIGRSAKIYL